MLLLFLFCFKQMLFQFFYENQFGIIFIYIKLTENLKFKLVILST